MKVLERILDKFAKSKFLNPTKAERQGKKKTLLKCCNYRFYCQAENEYNCG